jgi:hypothetical protein
MKKTLILAIDVGDLKNDWEVKAMSMQVSDYFEKNKTILDVENVFLFPIEGDMKLFWLEGDPDSVKDVKDLEKIRDRLEPVLEVALGIKRRNPGVKRISKNKRRIHPKKRNDPNHGL